ncbi:MULTISPECIES: hypothetical protein [unclassified Mycoplasma]|uniref:hypothetical protein n=1 Tax=unclassified Mycoplasma TaxID=2683645 RepID=UPI000FDE8178
MKKSQFYAVLSIVSLLLIVFASLFSVYFQKYQQLDANLEKGSHYGGKEVRLMSKTFDGKQEMDQIYVTKSDHKTLEDLILWINKFEVEQKITDQERFGFRDHHSLYGLFVNRVNGVFADYNDESESWWKILSPTASKPITNSETPLDYSRDFAYQSFGEQSRQNWTTNFGISGIPLVADTIVIFVQTAKWDMSN